MKDFEAYLLSIGFRSTNSDFVVGDRIYEYIINGYGIVVGVYSEKMEVYFSYTPQTYTYQFRFHMDGFEGKWMEKSGRSRITFENIFEKGSIDMKNFIYL